MTHTPPTPTTPTTPPTPPTPSTHPLTTAWIQAQLKPRQAHSHKGSYGHALLIAGARGSVGAALLAARACLRSGAGKLTVHAPECAYIPLQTALPEAMVQLDSEHGHWSDAFRLTPYDAIGIGCGIGQSTPTRSALHTLILQNQSQPKPMVLDADALNILAQEPHLLTHLPQHTILTPHPKELQRLLNAHPDAHTHAPTQTDEPQAHHTQAAQTLATQYQLILVLKGHLAEGKTAIITPERTTYTNPTGNPGMAKAGNGDALTGIILALLSQGYSPTHAACIGVYWHGAAGDAAAKKYGQHSMLASDLVECLGTINPFQ